MTLPIEPGCYAVTCHSPLPENNNRVVKVLQFVDTHAHIDENNLWEVSQDFSYHIFGTDITQWPYVPEYGLIRIDGNFDLTEEKELEVIMK